MNHSMFSRFRTGALVFLLAIFPAPAAMHAQPPQAVRTEDHVRLDAGAVSITVHLASGQFDLTWPNGASIRGITAAVKLADGSANGAERVAARFVEHRYETEAVDGGTRLIVSHRDTDGLVLRHILNAGRGRADVELRVDVQREDGADVRTRHITPLLIEGEGAGASLGDVKIAQLLSVPYDNDEYSRYDSTPAKDGLTRSSELTALFDDASRRAIVFGAVTHDTWKTGIEIASPNAEGVVTALRAFGGKADTQTHDREPHGIVSGTTVSSPTLFISAADDWRDGLLAYSKANATVRPALPWNDGVPFGWNSWAAHKSELTVENVEAAIDLVDALKTQGFANDGTAYVNLDSFWDKLTDAQLKALIDDAHRRGLKFGLYWTPFCFWGDEPSLSRTIENIEGKYTFLDAAIKGTDGKPLPKHSGAFALDPTHPGTRARNAALYARFVALGIDFVKLDFLSHGALEGKHFDPAIQTGTQAYHVGMSDVLSAFNEKKTGRPIFISLSIAPLFPHGYGHARRMTCDVFASLDATKYLLNGLTYAFWTHGTLYAFNDPDHTVVHHVHGEKPVGEAIATARFNASLISGGMLLDSDDAGDRDARERVSKFFTMPSIVGLARTAQTFRPVEGSAGHDASSAYVLGDGSTTYLAVFNFDEKAATTLRVEISRIGLESHAAMRLVDLASGAVIATSKEGKFEIALAPAGSRVLRVENQPAS